MNSRSRPDNNSSNQMIVVSVVYRLAEAVVVA
jgi:hypothetical protein